MNDWTEVYKRLHSVSENTELKSFLYKLLFGALSCNQKFKNVICYLCNKEQESVDHLFYKCESTSTLYDIIKIKLENKNINFSKNEFCFTINLTKHDYKILCIFLFSVWLTRNKARNEGNNDNYIYVFKSIFNRNIEPN